MNMNLSERNILSLPLEYGYLKIYLQEKMNFCSSMACPTIFDLFYWYCKSVYLYSLIFRFFFTKMFICIVYFLLYSMNVLLNCIILFVLYELYLHCIILHLCLIISVCMKNHPEVTSISLIFFFRKEININVISIIWKKIKLLISHRFALILWTFTNRWTIKKILENIDVQLLFWIYYIEYYQDVWLLQSK